MKLFNHIFPGKDPNRLNQIMPRRLYLLDIGARGGMQAPWNFLTHNQISSILVEPDPEEAKRLEQKYGKGNVLILPTGLWKHEGKIILNVNRSPGTSSVLLPNKLFLDQFPESDRYNVVSRYELAAVTIDNLVSRGILNYMDFMKIDVQGAELSILEGGCTSLQKNLIGLEVEIEFSKIYENQPLFCDVESFIRNELGLELWDIRKSYWKYKHGNHYTCPVKGRLIFGDALFFRPITGIENWLSIFSDTEAKAKLIMLIISAITYGYLDYALAIITLPLSQNHLSAHDISSLNSIIKKSTHGLRPFRYGNSRLHMIFDALAKAFQPTYKGWASIERCIGSRRWKNFWL